jgi:hypothetical protein
MKGEMKNSHKILVGNTEKRIRFWGSGWRWEVKMSNKMNVNEIWCKGVNWINLA